jgi:thiol-disulfide isomerase/thioredoxin
MSRKIKLSRSLFTAGFAVAFALFLAAAFYSFGALSGGIRPASGAGAQGLQAAPDFTVSDSAGNSVKLSDMTGRPVMVNFWASWCPPCREEMPYIEELYREQGGEISFMIIDLVGGGETRDTAEKFLKSQGYTFPVYYDNTGEAADQYAITAIPTSVFIDSRGRIVSSVRGAMDKSTMRGRLDSIKSSD